MLRIPDLSKLTPPEPEPAGAEIEVAEAFELVQDRFERLEGALLGLAKFCDVLGRRVDEIDHALATMPRNG